MAEVAIGRLRVRGPPESAARTAFLIEDGCRTEIPDSSRLILVRRLDLGPSAKRRGEQAALIRRAYDDALLGARHGGSDGAGDSNCVWFATRAEARRLLLAALLAGKRPAAWFWRLAVAEWRGQSAEEWLGTLAAPALRGGGEPDLLEIVTLAVEAGAVEMLVRVLAGPPCLSPAAAPAPDVRDLLATRAEAPAGRSGAPAASAEAETLEAVLRLRARLAPAFAARVEEVARRIGPGSRPAALLLERLLLVASPSLALAPALLRELAHGYAGFVAVPAPEPAANSADAPSVLPSQSESGPDHSPEILSRTAASREAEAPAARRREQAKAPEEPSRADQILAEPPASPVLAEEAESGAAGLWLVIPSLIRMGFREWLAERPDLLCDDPGRTLLRLIARHHRVSADDPAFLPLAVEEKKEPPEWALLWRLGLDRWLRRNARLPLHALVWRRGWLRFDGDKLSVRFPPAAADLRLRRRALDVDPGWTDWLGLVVRYAFAERTVL
jgi:hypothetical protein